MLTALLVFLVGCLVVVVVLYALQIVLKRMSLPEDVKQLFLLIVGVLVLVALLCLVVQTYRSGNVNWL